MAIRSVDAAIEPCVHGGLWRHLQELAFEAIKIAELEKSGIRDGDGYWHGGDVIGHLLVNLQNIVSRLEAAYDMAPRAATPREAAEDAQASLPDDDIPW